ncbi:MAG: hypothetical protein LBF97_04430 [Elusimicrobiota bacterium]|jgi:hypothetical protein|nr:hypothetical protein [Elusimicrobiota bacterium]
MLNKIKIISIISMIIFLSFGALFGEGLLENDIVSINTSVGYVSKYVPRGFIGDKNSVIQTDFSVSLYNFTAEVFATQALHKDDNGDVVGNEVDYILQYDRTFFENLNLSLGYAIYAYPSKETDSPDYSEIYFKASYNFLITPSLFFGDDPHNGWKYFEFGLSYSQSIVEKLGLDLGATYGNNSGIKGSEGSYINLGLTINAKLTDNLTISPNVHLLSGRTKDLKKDKDNEVYGGVSLGYSI